MSNSERWFRWCFNFFIFMMFAQLGFLIAVKSLFLKQEKLVSKHTANVEFRCGDFNKDTSYWDLKTSKWTVLPNCFDNHCPESLWVNPKEQDVEVQVVAVGKAKPSYWEEGQLQSGHYVDVHIKETNKPVKLVLVSQSMLQWNIKGNAKKKVDGQSSDSGEALSSPMIDEVIVVGPELVWLDGLSDKTKITFFNKDQVCAYPTAWEEVGNSENQFRRLFLALKEYTGYEIHSFQGREVGQQFQVPYKNLLAQERADTTTKRALASFDGMGLQWERKDQKVVPKEFKRMRNGELQSSAVPPKTQQAYFELGTETLFLIQNFQVGIWDENKKSFKALRTPLSLPALYWPTALAFNPLTSELLVYNDDRGGEVFAYNVVKKEWRLYAIKVGYSLMALSFDTEKEVLLGARYKSNKIIGLTEIQGTGQVAHRPLSPAIDFIKSKWSLQMYKKNGQAWLEVIHPASPQGEVFPL